MTFTATVTASGATPVGTVTFEQSLCVPPADNFHFTPIDGSGPIRLDSSGVASITTTGLSVSPAIPLLPDGDGGLTVACYVIRASYSGSSGLASSTTTIRQDVFPSVGLISNGYPCDGASLSQFSEYCAEFSSPLTFTASVGSINGIKRTGSVTFTDGGVVIGNSPVTGLNNTASLDISTLSIGRHVIRAEYLSDQPTLQNAFSRFLFQRISFSTTTVLGTSNNAVFLWSPVTLTASVSSVGGIPTGTVNFLDGNAVVGSSPLNSGTAALTTQNLSPGSHTVRAQYVPELNNPKFMASSSNGVMQKILPEKIVVPTDNSGGVSPAPAAGRFAVSSDGASTYTYPIWVPHGRRGIEPTLAISYNSRRNNGVVGVGWSVEGLSSITRCKRDIARDGHNATIQFNDSDAFCLDGQRLVPIYHPTNQAKGQYNKTKSLRVDYRTEEDRFVRIIMGPSDDKGPVSFEVDNKDGRKFLYGTTPDSRYEGARFQRDQATQHTVRLTWSLAEVRDRFGNNMTVHYLRGVTRINVLKHGGGYRSPVVSFVGGGGTGATASATLNQEGQIADITVITPGSGYSSPPTVVISDRDGGSGASAEATIMSEQLPRTIQYTGTVDNSLLPQRAVTFNYDEGSAANRPDISPHYVSGLYLENAHLLTSIDLSAPTLGGANQNIRSYKFTYQRASSTGRSLLSQISECDAAGVCLVPTVYSYSQQPDGFTDIDTGIHGPRDSQADQVFVGDLNGDGCDDFVYRARDKSGRFSEAGYALSPCYEGIGVLPFRVYRITPFSPDSPSNVPFAIFTPNTAAPGALGDHEQLLALDLDLDGRVDLFHYSVVNHQKYPGTYSIPGQDFATDVFLASGVPPGEWNPSKGLFEKLTSLSSHALYYDPGYPASFYYTGTYIGDINGDGFPDLVHLKPDGWTFQLNHGRAPICVDPILVNAPGGACLSLDSESPLIPGFAPSYNSFNPVYMLDVDQDGTTKIILRDPNDAQFYAAFSLSATTPPVLRPPISLGLKAGDTYNPPRRDWFLDMNGDGLPDALAIPEQEAPWISPWISTNTGNGFTDPTAVPMWPMITVDSSRKLLFFDYDGDGSQDIVYNDVFGGSVLRAVLTGRTAIGDNPFNARMNIQLVNQDHKPIPAGTCMQQASPCLWAFDANGDGLMDLIQIVGGTIHVYVRRGPKPDLLVNVLDRGASISVSYAPITSKSVYGTTVPPGIISSSTVTLPGSTYVLNRGLWVVSSYTIPGAGLGSPNTYSFYYEDGRASLLGRGWLGFASVKRTDAQTGTVTTTTYDNSKMIGSTYPLAMKPQKVEITVKLSDDGSYNKKLTTTTYSIGGSADGKYITVLPKEILQQEWEAIRHSEIKPPVIVTSLIRTFDTIIHYDDFGNMASTTRTTGDGWVDTHTVTYQYNEPEWLVAMPKQITDTSSTSDGQTATRTTQFIPDVNTGATTAEIIEQYNQINYHLDLYGMLRGFDSNDLTKQQPQRNVTIQLDPLEDLYPTTVRNVFGQTEYRVFHPALGVLLAAKDANGVIEQWQYDGFGRLKQVLAPDGANLSVTYKADFYYVDCNTVQCLPGFQVWTEYASGYTDVVRYDPYSFEILRDSAGFNGLGPRRTLTYNSLGLVATTEGPCFPYTSPCNTSSRVQYTYDNLGRLNALLRGDGSASKWVYTGLQTTVYDAGGNHRYAIEDQMGHVTKSVAITGGREIPTNFTFEPFGLLHTLTDANLNVTRIVHDARGRPLVLNDPDIGDHFYQWTSFDELYNENYGNNRNRTYDRDALGRVRTVKDKDGTTTINWDTAQNGIGKVADATSTDGVKTSYAYNSLGQLVGSTWNIDGDAYTFGFTYDTLGRRSSVIYPSEPWILALPHFIVRYEYNGFGFLKRIVNPTADTLLWQVDAENELGEITREEFGNGLITQRSFDARGRVRQILTTRNGVQQQNLTYSYLRNGSLSCRSDWLPSFTIAESFLYDPLDRLADWKVAKEPTGPPPCPITAAAHPSALLDQTFAYDDIGNLKQRTTTFGSGPDLNYQYAQSGQYLFGPHAVTQVNSDSYDYLGGEGDQVAGPNRRVVYKAFDLPASVTDANNNVTTFKYDAGLQRTVKRYPNGDKTVYVGGLYERRVQNGHASLVFYVPGAGRIVAQVQPSAQAPNQILYLHDDALGSVQTVTNNSGATVDQRWYEPFGQLVDPANPQTNVTSSLSDVTLGFTGQSMDKDLNVINMKGRIYDAKIGRFLTPDPLVQDPLRSESLNPYSYAWNNPLKWVDPSGFQTGGVESSYSDESGLALTVALALDLIFSSGGSTSNASSQPSSGNPTTRPQSSTASDNGTFQTTPESGMMQYLETMATANKALASASDFANRWVTSAMDPRLQWWLNPVGAYNNTVIGGLMKWGQEAGVYSDPRDPLLILGPLGMAASSEVMTSSFVEGVEGPTVMATRPGVAINLFGEGEIAGYDSVSVNNLQGLVRPLSSIRGPIVGGDATALPFPDNSLIGIVAQRAPGGNLAMNDFGANVAAEAFRTLQPGRIFGIYSATGGQQAWIPYLKAAGFEQVQVWGWFAVGVKPCCVP